MEAVVLIGLLGAGYLMNNKDKKNQIVNHVNKDIHLPSMDTTYESNNYNNSEKMVRSLAQDNFESSYKPSNIVNHVNSDNTKLNENILKQNSNNSNYIYSNSAEGFINNEDFLTNDQGIKVAPFFSSQALNINFEDSTMLNRTQGRNEYYRNKQETTNFGDFHMRQETSGNYFDRNQEQESYNSSLPVSSSLTNQLPFSQELVAPIDNKSNFNREMGDMIYQRSNTDVIRTLTNPKISYEGKILAGKGHEHRGKIGDVYKHNPETFYDNNPDKWLVTNGAFLARSTRPEQMIYDTNRTFLNNQEMGGAAPAVQENAPLRSNYKKSLRQQLGSDTSRNVGSEVPMISTDLQSSGYRALPNERQVTELRTYDDNLKTEVGSQTVGIQDPIKRTIKETTIDSANNGFLGNNVDATTQRQYDSVRVTKKQTMINSANNGYLMGPSVMTKKPYDAPEWTTKDSTHFDYTGNAGAYIKGDMLQDNYKNAETNTTKEIIAQGRAPTLNNTKIANGMDTINMDIKKMDHDYMNHRLNGVDKVYGEIPQDNTCQITTTKDRLNDESIADRIDPNLLNPFKQNPYTQPLTSFSY